MAHLGLTGDFAMPNRCDLMSLQTINAKQDQVNTSTAKFNSKRFESSNLATKDIEGKLPLFLITEIVTHLFILRSLQVLHPNSTALSKLTSQSSQTRTGTLIDLGLVLSTSASTKKRPTSRQTTSLEQPLRSSNSSLRDKGTTH